MFYGLYISAAGAHAQSQKVEVLSNNLANVDTVGFKRELALLEARDSEAIERGLDFRGSGSLNNIGGGIRLPETATDFQVGAFRQTDFPADFALEDPSHFFLVQRGGEKLLTRAGNFQVDAEGRLLTQSGDPVLDTEQGPIQLDPNLPWIAGDGGIIDQFGDRFLLAMAKVADPQQLRKVGNNFFESTTGEVQAVPEEDRRVRNGWQEVSAVNPMQEMVELITASRAYETNIRLIQQHDGVTNSLVTRMLRTV